MAFNRVIKLKAGTTNNAKLVSGLDMSFTVSRSTDFSSNTAKITVYNTTKDTTNNILKKGNSIILEAGYADEGSGVIYIGQIVQSIPTYDSVNNIISIECGNLQSADTALEAVTVTLSYKPNTQVSQPINEIASGLGLALYGASNASGIVLPNGFVFSGTARQALDYCNSILRANGCQLYIDNNYLNIMKIGVAGNYDAVTLSPSTGLLSAPTVTDEKVEDLDIKRVVFSSLLNHKIVPNSTIVFDSPNLKAQTIVEKCNFSGDNMGGSFIVSGEAIIA